tara:strand:+ start:209 stop:991 length:783 start_codon:yes stop_codon:yes gene_type:complete
MSKAINDLTSDTDNDDKKLRENRDSTVSSDVNIHSSTDVDHTKSLDNSSDPYIHAQSNSIISSSNYILYPNTNSKDSNIVSISNKDIYNEYDKIPKNNTTSSVQKKMMKLCGATFDQSESAINIAKDEVMNNNVNNNNSFSNKNDILKSTSVRLESDINFVNSNVNKKCMLELLSNLVIEIEDDNNAINVSGGKGKDKIKNDNDNSLNSTMSEMHSKTQRLNDDSESEEINIKVNTVNKKGGGIQELLFVIIFLLILIYI